MVFAARPVIEEAKLLVPVPSLVVLSEVVGFVLVLQHTPFAVILAPPSSMDSPPLDADEQVIDEIDVVVMVGAVILTADFISRAIGYTHPLPSLEVIVWFPAENASDTAP